ncbi:hypothetical protein ETD86_51035 [Nonomuraea turkmeniaca]|uniref:Uncharacterized protein n=1 Tax=Nonomuraea turkmeniaca TaxID=103838 RepID=A0A5S4EW77_9ACTN|nr:hypothetical protein [Nonomuraea turkmeniaca]TMR07678.1 hypothetical protein ETD86_51035 [Nonomuraea turkmeniaca]
MEAVLKVFGWLLLLQGVGGLVNALLGWWEWAESLIVVNHLEFLHGHEVFAGIVIGVLGFVLLTVADSAKSAEAGE